MRVQLKLKDGPSTSQDYTSSRRVRLLQVGVIFLVTLCLIGGVKRYRAYAQAENDRQVCYRNLQIISAAFLQYRKDHHGRLPRLLVPNRSLDITESETLYPRYIKSLDTLICQGYVRHIAQQGSTYPANDPTYEYVVQGWVQDIRGLDYFPSSEFYGQIVPAKKDSIRLLQCDVHPGNGTGKVWAIMWDGSIKEVPTVFDNSFGRWRRVPELRTMREIDRKRGASLPPDE